MHQAVLVHADVDERSEVRDVGHDAFELHSGRQVSELFDPLLERGGAELGTRIPPGLLELRQDILHRRQAELRVDELLGFGDTLRATLDCTGGWYAEQEWAGARLDRLLNGSEDGSIVVRSVTGYSRRFPRSDASGLLLATHVGGEPLSAGHGAPARLVAPGRRGFWWVKWVTAIDVTDEPWWWQPPFPLT